jgi:hypothetical protein
VTFKIEDYPKPSTLKWAMLVVMLDNQKPMVAGEIDRSVAKLLNIPVDMFEAVLENGRQYVPYRLGWERTKSKKFGYIEKAFDKPRSWQLTESGRKIALRKAKFF